MIDFKKWEQSTDEQKMQTCKAVSENINVGSITKADWKLMFDFLLEKVRGEQ